MWQHWQVLTKSRNSFETIQYISKNVFYTIVILDNLWFLHVGMFVRFELSMTIIYEKSIQRVT